MRIMFMGNLELVKIYEAISYEEADAKLKVEQVTFCRHMKMKLIIAVEEFFEIQGIRHVETNDDGTVDISMKAQE